MSRDVRLGLVGLGGMGKLHAANLLAGKVPRLKLVAVADTDPVRRSRFQEVAVHATLDEMIAEGDLDAILIATPHYHHVSLALTALEAGLHVLVEKPIGVQKADAERILRHRLQPGQVAAAMFNQRTDDYFIQLRELIRRGDAGAVRRISWTITDWFRTDRYYATGGWRATWAGEGGGVLLNQGIHNLDLLHWIFGPPARVRAFCGFGRYHPIEVEDDVTAYLEFDNGATAVFVSSTGEAPGTNRLEIAAERGRIVYEGDRLVFLRNAVAMTDFSRTCSDPFGRPATEEVPIPARGHGGQHLGILTNFADAILDGETLIAPLADGMHSLELANAMLLSAWTGETIELPLDGARYAQWLDRKIAETGAR